MYDDTLKIDTNNIKGYVHVVDTTQFDKLAQRHFDFVLNYNKITETIKTDHYITPTRKFFIGGGLLLSKQTPIYGIEAGLIYLDRHDRLFQGDIGVDINQQSYIKLGTYWKINLKKK